MVLLCKTRNYLTPFSYVRVCVPTKPQTCSRTQLSSDQCWNDGTSLKIVWCPCKQCGGFALLGGARLDAGLGGGGIGEQGAQAHQPGTEQDVSLQHGDYIIQSCIL